MVSNRYSKRDYEMVARIMRNAREESETPNDATLVDTITTDFADAFESDGNPLFNRHLFLKASGALRPKPSHRS